MYSRTRFDNFRRALWSNASELRTRKKLDAGRWNRADHFPRRPTFLLSVAKKHHTIDGAPISETMFTYGQFLLEDYVFYD